MGLSDLPLELFREILVHAVRVRGTIQQSLRLRLVNRQFSEEVNTALFHSGLAAYFLLQPGFDKVRDGCGDSFWQSYLTHKVLATQKPHAEYVGVIRSMVEYLCKKPIDASDSTMRRYVHAICSRPSFLLDQHRYRKHPIPTQRLLLQGAIINDCLDEVKEILDNPDVSLTILDYRIRSFDFFNSPLWLAGRTANIGIIDFLFSKRIKSLDDMRELVMKGAIYGGHLDIVRYVMDRRWGPVNFISSSHCIEEPFVHGVMSSPHPDFCTQLYNLIRSHRSLGYSIELADINLDDLLYHVAGWHWQRADVAEYLLDAGATVQVKRNPTARNSRMPWNPLRQAVVGGNEKIVKLLLDRGADPNSTDEDVLFQAARRGRRDIVTMLVEHGAEVERRKLPNPFNLDQPEPMPPIEAARLAENHEMVNFLRKHGATSPRS